MSLSPMEQSARRAAIERMDARQRLGYVLDYYKLPIALALIALVILGSTVHRRLTKKNAVLYAAFVNVSVGETLEQTLTDGFLDWCGADPRKNEVCVYRDLYLSDDASFVNHEYAYASRLKLLGAINAGRLDLVLMNREAYDLLSRSGYLLDLSALALSGTAAACLVENEVVLEDNVIEYNLNEADVYREITERVVNALDVSALPRLRDAGFSGAVYLGVVANTARGEDAVRYLSYLSE